MFRLTVHHTITEVHRIKGGKNIDSRVSATNGIGQADCDISLAIFITY